MYEKTGSALVAVPVYFFVFFVGVHKVGFGRRNGAAEIILCRQHQQPEDDGSRQRNARP